MFFHIFDLLFIQLFIFTLSYFSKKYILTQNEYSVLCFYKMLFTAVKESHNYLIPMSVKRNFILKRAYISKKNPQHATTCKIKFFKFEFIVILVCLNKILNTENCQTINLQSYT